MSIAIDLPVLYENIPKEMERLKGELLRLETEKKIIRTLVDAVRACCPHKDESMYYYTTMGESGSRCRHCGMET